MSNETITIRLSPRDVDMIDSKVKDGHFTSRSDLIRYSIRHVLNEMEVREQNLALFQDLARSKGITRESLQKSIRGSREEVYEEVYGRD
jgi:Arc/MetJ-type ribon-helix-helix transcriptional regulator